MGQKDDLIKAGTGYMAGQAIANNIAYNLKKQREELEARIRHITTTELLQEGITKFILSDKKEEAYEWLNESIQTEIIGDAKQQENSTISLPIKLQKTKAKFAPFYAKIGRTIPDNINSLSAEQLCGMVGVKLLPQSYYDEKIKEIDRNETREGCGLVFRAILIIGLIIITIIAVASE